MGHQIHIVGLLEHVRELTGSCGEPGLHVDPALLQRPLSDGKFVQSVDILHTDM